MNELSFGSQAVHHIEPYLPEIARNHETPAHFGRAISAWDDPKWVRAEEASHMRDDDYVVGIVHKGMARAYPLWVVDYHHVINDVIAGDPVLFVSCDACQSGAAFFSSLEGKRLKFAVAGMYNATFLMTDRSGMFQRKGSLWLHYEGAAFHGELRETFLAPLPAFHTTWKDWRRMHPQTEVMLPPADRHHRDARHGHGRGEYFSRPGLSPDFVPILSGPLDDRYPENEMVLGINADQGVKAYPLREVKMAGGVVHDELGGCPIVVFAGPRPEQFTMAAFSPRVDGRILRFNLQGEHFMDDETRTLWSMEGKAVQGPLRGQELIALRWSYLRWHAWFYNHRSSELYRYGGRLPSYPGEVKHLDLSRFQPVLKGLLKVGREIQIEGAVVNLRLPHEAEEGICLRIGGERLNLYLFRNREAAEDYVALRGVWNCLPDGSAKTGRKLSCRAGAFVLESDPEIQYADPCQNIQLPDSQIRWSELVTDPELIRVWKQDVPESGDSLGPTFSGLFQHLRGRGYDVVRVGFLPHGQLQVGTVNIVTATVRSEPFILYKCEDAACAQRLVLGLPHAFQVGRFVFRPTPMDMYQSGMMEIADQPEDEIHWGKLVANDRFVGVLSSYLEPSAAAGGLKSVYEKRED